MTEDTPAQPTPAPDYTSERAPESDAPTQRLSSAPPNWQARVESLELQIAALTSKQYKAVIAMMEAQAAAKTAEERCSILEAELIIERARL